MLDCEMKFHKYNLSKMFEEGEKRWKNLHQNEF